jgi:hypothetical protein
MVLARYDFRAAKNTPVITVGVSIFLDTDGLQKQINPCRFCFSLDGDGFDHINNLGLHFLRIR